MTAEQERTCADPGNEAGSGKNDALVLAYSIHGSSLSSRGAETTLRGATSVLRIVVVCLGIGSCSEVQYMLVSNYGSA